MPNSTCLQFKQFLEGVDDVVPLNFMEDVQAYTVTQTAAIRAARAEEIYRQYLQEGTSGVGPSLPATESKALSYSNPPFRGSSGGESPDGGSSARSEPDHVRPRSLRAGVAPIRPRPIEAPPSSPGRASSPPPLSRRAGVGVAMALRPPPQHATPQDASRRWALLRGGPSSGLRGFGLGLKVRRRDIPRRAVAGHPAGVPGGGAGSGSGRGRVSCDPYDGHEDGIDAPSTIPETEADRSRLASSVGSPVKDAINSTADEPASEEDANRKGGGNDYKDEDEDEDEERVDKTSYHNQGSSPPNPDRSSSSSASHQRMWRRATQGRNGGPTSGSHSVVMARLPPLVAPAPMSQFVSPSDSVATPETQSQRSDTQSIIARAHWNYANHAEPTTLLGVRGVLIDLLRSRLEAIFADPAYRRFWDTASDDWIMDDGSTTTTAPSPASLPLEMLPPDLFDEVRDMVLEGVRERQWDRFVESRQFSRWQLFKCLEQRSVTVNDFIVFRVLGRGGFGAVNGCKKCDTGALFAVKVMNKRRVKQRNAIELCWSERRILADIESPFVTSLKYAFQTSENLYLVLDIMTGGDLAFHLSRRGRFHEDRARFYAAQILLGIEHLHSRGIVYRDLKPENILLDAEGNCRISDLGLATRLPPNGYVSGRCGTRGYWAPEMLVRIDGARQPYTYTVDWWSLGCVLYELLEGKCPFRSELARSLDSDRHRSMDRATMYLEVPYDARYFSPEARSLIKGLLERNPVHRLGARGADEIKQHPFFADIDWGLLETEQVAPPFVPDMNINAASQDVIGAFDDSKTRHVELTEDDQQQFRGWDFVNTRGFQGEVMSLLLWTDDDQRLFEATRSGCCIIL